MQTNFDELEASEQRLNKEKREAQREVCCDLKFFFSFFFINYKNHVCEKIKKNKNVKIKFR
jgi:hypothetical protein